MEVRLAAFVPREGRLLQQGDSWARQLLDVLQSPRVGEAVIPSADCGRAGRSSPPVKASKI